MSDASRPDISTIADSAELRRWYWLKKELAAEAKRVGVKSTGAKFTILDRLCHYLDTGELAWPGDAVAKPQSKFDWGSSDLTPETVLTDNYRNTQNVRRFFQAHMGESFKFSIALMDWCRSNAGKTLGDAVAFLRNQQQSAGPTQIKPHNQFNQYCRDFLADNPTLGMKEARAAWFVRRRMPSEDGRHVYRPGDVAFVSSGDQPEP